MFLVHLYCLLDLKSLIYYPTIVPNRWQFLHLALRCLPVINTLQEVRMGGV
jgi:hypothetical protein